VQRGKHTTRGLYLTRGGCELVWHTRRVWHSLMGSDHGLTRSCPHHVFCPNSLSTLLEWPLFTFWTTTAL
jgi:hypothetical protein